MKVFLACIAAAIILVGCGQQSQAADQASVEQQQTIYQSSQPIPVFDFSLERDIVIQLYQLRNRAVSTHTVIRSQAGAYLWDCPSVGYPIPFDTSLTNPLQKICCDGAVVEQPEPNGLYPSKNSDGTWVMCVADKGVVTPVYTEEKASAYPFAVTVDDEGRVTRAGAENYSTVEIKKR